ncbi:MAG: hypothetical protein HY816_11415 [Candidatus Wallbacteria bacterium]|nr:hypothetical protein [Candidatus Wallbacteria bacterium]
MASSGFNPAGLRSVGCLGAVLLMLLLCPGAGQAQSRLAHVTISSPQGTAQTPYRTSFQQLAIAFGHDGGSGTFIAQSQGADVNGTNFLINESSGTVGAYFNTPGLKTVSVRVTAQPTTVIAVSQPVFIVFDNQAPVLTLTQIRVDPRLAWEAFDPARSYYTSADAIGLRGLVNDGPSGAPPEQLVLTARAGSAPATTSVAGAGGQFELSVSLTGMPEGPGQISLTVADKMSDGSRPNVGKGPVIRLGE